MLIDNNVVNSTKVENSEFVFNSESVKNSKYVSSSSFIEDSRNIDASTYINSSSCIEDSHNIKSSSFVLRSGGVDFSNEIYASSFISKSKLIWQSSSIIRSSAIFNSNDIIDSAFCHWSKGLKHCAFCNNVHNVENYLFNKPVDPHFVDFFLGVAMDILQQKNDVSMYQRATNYSTIKLKSKEWLLSEIFTEDTIQYLSSAPNFNKDLLITIEPYLD